MIEPAGQRAGGRELHAEMHAVSTQHARKSLGKLLRADRRCMQDYPCMQENCCVPTCGMHAVHAAAHVQTMETVGKTAASKNGTLRSSKTEVSDVDEGDADKFKKIKNKITNGTLPI